MGFKVEFNSILRTDEFESVEEGKTYKFEKDGSRIFFDDIQIWLVRSDWTAIAEIQVLNQKRENGSKVSGEFEVKHVMTEEESRVVTEMFRRMYGWE